MNDDLWDGVRGLVSETWEGNEWVELLMVLTRLRETGLLALSVFLFRSQICEFDNGCFSLQTSILYRNAGTWLLYTESLFCRHRGPVSYTAPDTRIDFYRTHRTNVCSDRPHLTQSLLMPISCRLCAVTRFIKFRQAFSASVSIRTNICADKNVYTVPHNCLSTRVHNLSSLLTEQVFVRPIGKMSVRIDRYRVNASSTRKKSERKRRHLSLEFHMQL